MSEPFAALRKMYPLDSLLSQHLCMIADEMTFDRRQRNEQLFSEGESDQITYYLIEGDIKAVYPDGRERDFSSTSVKSRYALGDFQPRRFDAIVKSKSALIASIQRAYLEKVIIWDQAARASGVQENKGGKEQQKWLKSLFQSKAIHKVPAANMQRLFDKLEEVERYAGDKVIAEGDEGDYFYIIKQGELRVSRGEAGETAELAKLLPGDSFGEDALLTREPRNASVRMLTNGILMRLSKMDFNTLLKVPSTDWTDPRKASTLVREGAGLIDVRMPQELTTGTLKGAINVPLSEIRNLKDTLDPEKHYIVCCNTGMRSASASFILKQMGYKVSVLQGGINALGA
ncbi:MAG: cyclic nucleotide-binding domain-containing protein [bacterium]